MRTSRGDAGQSLVEVLVAVVILGISFVAIIGGLANMAIGSDVHRKQVDTHNVLVSAAERVKAAPHVACATSGSYLTSARDAPRPTGWPVTAITITSVTYWDGTAFGPTCYDTDALGHVLTLQLVTVKVESPEGRAVDILHVSKRAQ